ncbi:MAG: HTH domain-containing protein [Candidatus Methanofastidiosia archaeon]
MVRRRTLKNAYFMQILQVLSRSPRPLTKNEIAKYTGMSWNTVDKYITVLYRKGNVKRITSHSREYWK